MYEREGLEVKAGCVNEGERSCVKEEKSTCVGGWKGKWIENKKDKKYKRKKKGRQKNRKIVARGKSNAPWRYSTSGSTVLYLQASIFTPCQPVITPGLTAIVLNGAV